MSSPPSPQSESTQVKQLQKQLRWAEMRIQSLEELLRLARIAKYGPGSEKLNSTQLELLEFEPGVSGEEVEAESKREPIVPAAPQKKRKQHPGRQTPPADLPRVERLLPSTPEQCTCRSCGGETVVIGCEQSEQLDVKPAEYFVSVIKREKRACQACEVGSVVTAPLPARIIDKSLVSDQFTSALTKTYPLVLARSYPPSEQDSEPALITVHHPRRKARLCRIWAQARAISSTPKACLVWLFLGLAG